MTQRAEPKLAQSLEDARRVLDLFCADPGTLEALEQTASLLADRIDAGGRVLAVGNGGSMAQAMHLAEELSGRFRNDRRPLPAMACTDVGHITCTANDYGYDAVFERWVRALGAERDTLVCLSTSGNSANIIRAADAGRDLGMSIVGLVGRGGGKLQPLCDRCISVPGETADRIQEIHTLVMHTLIEGIEQRLGLA